jgi:FkbM family methyltransferase
MGTQSELLALRLRKLVAAVSTSFGRAALRQGVAASIEHRAGLGGMNFRTVVDVGANRGQFALFCRGEFPQATIISFEPLPHAAKKFHQVFRDDSNVTLHEMALGAAAGEAVMRVTNDDDASSLLPVSTAQGKLFGTREVSQQTVPVRRLDKELPLEQIVKPALLKIDVQGFELEVLRGATNLLPAFEAVYVEASFRELYVGQALVNEVIDLLNSVGFRLAGVYNQTVDHDGQPVQADFLFRCGRA